MYSPWSTRTHFLQPDRRKMSQKGALNSVYRSYCAVQVCLYPFVRMLSVVTAVSIGSLLCRCEDASSLGRGTCRTRASMRLYLVCLVQLIPVCDAMHVELPWLVRCWIAQLRLRALCTSFPPEHVDQFCIVIKVQARNLHVRTAVSTK